MSPHRAPLRARVRRLGPERRAGALAVVVALLGSGAMVWQAGSAALGAPSSDPAASWSAGSVLLGDDDAGSALLGVSNLRPGSAGVRCIGVSATGDDAATIRLYGTRASSTRGLASHVTLTITEGTGGGSGSCAGFTPEARNAVVYRGSVADFAARATPRGCRCGRAPERGRRRGSSASPTCSTGSHPTVLRGVRPPWP